MKKENEDSLFHEFIQSILIVETSTLHFFKGTMTLLTAELKSCDQDIAKTLLRLLRSMNLLQMFVNQKLHSLTHYLCEDDLFDLTFQLNDDNNFSDIIKTVDQLYNHLTLDDPLSSCLLLETNLLKSICKERCTLSCKPTIANNNNTTIWMNPFVTPVYLLNK